MHTPLQAMLSLVVYLRGDTDLQIIYNSLVKQLMMTRIHLTTNHACIIDIDSSCAHSKEWYDYALSNGVAIGHHHYNIDVLRPWNDPADLYLRTAYRKQYMERNVAKKIPPQLQRCPVQRLIHETVTGEIIQLY